MKKAGKRALIIVGALAFLGVIALAAGLYTKQWVDSQAWPEAELSNTADGTYTGEFTYQLPMGAVAANPGVKVVVEVKDHRYAGFTVLVPKERNTGLEELQRQVIEKQTLHPDAVSGATVTNTAFLNAVGKAIASADGGQQAER